MLTVYTVTPKLFNHSPFNFIGHQCPYNLAFITEKARTNNSFRKLFFKIIYTTSVIILKSLRQINLTVGDKIRSIVGASKLTHHSFMGNLAINVFTSTNTNLPIPPKQNDFFYGGTLSYYTFEPCNLKIYNFLFICVTMTPGNYDT